MYPDLLATCTEGVFYIGKLAPDGRYEGRTRKLVPVANLIPRVRADLRFENNRYMGCFKLFDGTEIISDLTWSSGHRQKAPYEDALITLMRTLVDLYATGNPSSLYTTYANLGLAGSETSSIYDADPSVVGHVVEGTALLDDQKLVDILIGLQPLTLGINAHHCNMLA